MKYKNEILTATVRHMVEIDSLKSEIRDLKERVYELEKIIYQNNV